MELKQLCRGEPQNFANWPAEFGKICCEKLWALATSVNKQQQILNTISPQS